MNRGFLSLAAVVSGVLSAPPPVSADIVAAVLPNVRSVLVGQPATAFATIINAGPTTVTDCQISLDSGAGASLLYQTTNGATNALTGTPNTPASIASGQAQSYMIAVTAREPTSPIELPLNFQCSSGLRAASQTGVNTLQFSASSTPVPDMIALAATLSNDGIVTAPVHGTGAFAVATFNLGSSEAISVVLDTGDASLPVSLSVCETVPTNGACLAPPAPIVNTFVATGATPTFGIFVDASQSIPFSPGANRVFVRFRDQGGVVRGATSVAVLAADSFSVSGTMRSASISAMDTDVNDPAAPYEDNDRRTDAQQIGNPVIVGGYLKHIGSGEPGRLNYDRDDFFEVDLAVGELIRLHIADDLDSYTGTRNDLDLYLYDAAGNIVQTSVGTGATETLIADRAGTYFVNARVWQGASNYVLTIGMSSVPTSATTAASELSSVLELVPDQAIVRFKGEILSTAAMPSLDLVESFGLRRRAGDTGRSMLFTLEQGSAPSADLQTLGLAERHRDQSGKLAAMDPGLRAKVRTLLDIKALRQRPDVESASPNYILRPLRTPNDALYPRQWHYPLISLPETWDITTGSSDVLVAVVDTGVLSDHPDLQGQLVSGYDFVSDPSISGDGDGIDPDPSDPGDGQTTGTSSFHGTHVAGTVAARTNNGTGVAGVAWNARIMPIRALGIGGGTSYDVQQGFRYAAGLPNDSGTVPPQRADIINMSVGGGGFIQGMQDTIRQARDAGVVVIAAAGNESTSLPSYPASYDGAISVSSVGPAKELAFYSNFGDFIDVAAPGGVMSGDLDGNGFPDGVLSTAGDDSGASITPEYKYFQGTSMAAPHIAGVVALMKAVNPMLTPADLDLLLQSGNVTEDLGAPGWDNQFGWGLIDAYSAVVQAISLGGGVPPTPTPMLSISPSSLGFTPNVHRSELSVDNATGGELSITGVNAGGVGWLLVRAKEIDANGLGSYEVIVDRDGLQDGVYSTSIQFASSQNLVSVPVIMQVGSGTGGDAGFHYVLLADSFTRETRYQFAVGNNFGTYPFSFGGVAPGDYYLVAGTDSDYDGFICDAGDACGHYPTQDQPRPITVNRDLSDLNFDTGFNFSVDASTNSAIGDSNSGSVRGYRVLRPRSVR